MTTCVYPGYTLPCPGLIIPCDHRNSRYERAFPPVYFKKVFILALGSDVSISISGLFIQYTTEIVI